MTQDSKNEQNLEAENQEKAILDGSAAESLKSDETLSIQREVSSSKDAQDLQREIERLASSEVSQAKSGALDSEAKSKQNAAELSKLLEIAKSKGLAAAIKEAKKRKDDHLIDTLHDSLGQSGKAKGVVKKEF